MATEAGYMTPETVTPLLVKAHQEAMSLAAEAGYVTSETAGFVLPRAQMQAQSIANKAKERGYSPQ